MKRLVALVTVAALACGIAFVAAPAASQDVQQAATIRAPKPPPRCTAQGFRPWSTKVWHPSRWARGKPPKRIIRVQRTALRCAASPAHRRSMQRTWRRDKREFREHRERKIAERERQAYLASITPPGPDVLAAIRACESGGNYATNTGNGFYGAYQFLPSTWASVGGSGLPSDASPAEQDYRAAKLYREQGPSPWPVCAQ